jgi:hypothetical protein
MFEAIIEKDLLLIIFLIAECDPIFKRTSRIKPRALMLEDKFI